MKFLRELGRILSRLLTLSGYLIDAPFSLMNWFTDNLFGIQIAPDPNLVAQASAAKEEMAQLENRETMANQVSRLDDIRNQLREFHKAAMDRAQGRIPVQPGDSLLSIEDYAYLEALRPDEAQMIAALQGRDLYAFRKGNLVLESVRTAQEIEEAARRVSATIPAAIPSRAPLWPSRSTTMDHDEPDEDEDIQVVRFRIA